MAYRQSPERPWRDQLQSAIQATRQEAHAALNASHPSPVLRDWLLAIIDQFECHAAVRNCHALHPSTIASAFRRNGYRPPRRVHSALRLATALRALQAGLAVDGVAYGLGFAEASSFRRWFTVETGVTPSRWSEVPHIEDPGHLVRASLEQRQPPKRDRRQDSAAATAVSLQES